jgi:hypothetical protein
MQALFTGQTYIDVTFLTDRLHKIQHLGNEAGLPTREDIDRVRRRFGDPV